MTKFRAAVLPQTLALTVLLASACSGPAPADKPAAAAENAATRAIAAAVAGADDEDTGGMGSGTLSFQLKPGAALPLPITFCAGYGTVLTVAGREGETQVDLRVIDAPAIRDGKTLEEVTEAGYRFTGKEEGRVFQEVWQTRSIDAVMRDGETTRARGKMYGLRMYAKDNGAYTSPEAIDGGAERDFSLEVTCSAP